ncbi:MAG TPA: YlxM family DNA-binding protein [Clostridiales bacterium]|nr:YlxM family DNA-binding protein [Clostridiales bacterium]
MDKKLMVSLLLDFYGSLLSQKQREIMDFYYNDDLSLSEVADNIGITRQGVHDTVKRTETALYEMEEKLGLYKRFELVEKQLSAIENLSQNIEKTNEASYKDASIHNNVSKIIDIIHKLR